MMWQVIWRLVNIGGWITLAVVASLTMQLIINCMTIRRLDRWRPAPRSGMGARRVSAWPRVAVLIPARDEAENIERCLVSLLAQDYPNLMIAVLDDQSSDETAAIVARLAEGDRAGRLHLLTGAPLPAGWLGKCHACQQLAKWALDDVQMPADYLLFTDADTVHGSQSITNALALMEQQHLDLLSVLPRQRAGTLAEQILMPLLPLNILMLLPVMLVSRRPEPSLSAGIGQFLCFRRATYHNIGGHAAVRDQVLDDVQLARRAKSHGWRTDLVDGASAVQCRMYPPTAHNSAISAIWRGFSKNQYDFYGRSPLAVGIAVFALGLIFVIPPFICIIAFFADHLTTALPWFLAYLAAVILRVLILAIFGAPCNDLRTPGAWFAVLLQPVAAATQCAITLNSLRWGINGHLDWKGRTYAPVEQTLLTPR